MNWREFSKDIGEGGYSKVNFGRETGFLNRMRVLGMSDLLIAIRMQFGDDLADNLINNLNIDGLLHVMNTMPTFDDITIRED